MLWSRVVWQNVRPKVRPVVHTATNPAKKPPRITPVGLAFVLGGLAFASYFFRPKNPKMPVAALDNFKPKVAIVFGVGESKGVFKKSAQQLNFEYINVKEGFKKLDELVKEGKTRFFLEGFSSPAELKDTEENVVKPDLLLKFGEEASNNNPVSRVVGVCDALQVKEALKQRNLV